MGIESLPFDLGRPVMTPGARAALQEAGQLPQHFLGLHANGVWGDLEPEDKRANDQALRDGSRIFSAYHTKKGDKLWVITEADRAATTILLPSEY